MLALAANSKRLFDVLYYNTLHLNGSSSVNEARLNSTIVQSIRRTLRKNGDYITYSKIHDAYFGI